MCPPSWHDRLRSQRREPTRRSRSDAAACGDRGRRPARSCWRRPARRDERPPPRPGRVRHSAGADARRNGRGGPLLACSEAGKPPGLGFARARRRDRSADAQRSVLTAAPYPGRRDRAGVLPPLVLRRVRVPRRTAQRSLGEGAPRGNGALLPDGFVPYLFFSPVVSGGAPLGGCGGGVPRERLHDRRPADDRRQLRQRWVIRGDRDHAGYPGLPRLSPRDCHPSETTSAHPGLPARPHVDAADPRVPRDHHGAAVAESGGHLERRLVRDRESCRCCRTGSCWRSSSQRSSPLPR